MVHCEYVHIHMCKLYHSHKGLIHIQDAGQENPKQGCVITHTSYIGSDNCSELFDCMVPDLDQY